MQRLQLLAATLFALLIMATAKVCAEDAAQVAQAGSSNQLLVMADGRLVRGIIHIQAGGYSVEKAGGKLFIPQEQTRCVARDLPDAYRIQRESMRDPTAADLMALAEWCLSYRLYDEGRDELKRALRRDPANETARKMLTRLEEQLLTKPQPRATTPTSSDGFIVPEVEAIGGLSRPLAAQFTTRIQPLLVNRCGNASCHGVDTSRSFQITHVRIASSNHRRASEKNLAAALEQILIDDPLRSPLLMVSRGAHGGLSAPLFDGSAGRDQMDLLQTWVLAVSAERQAEAKRLAKLNPLKGSRAKPTPVAAVEPVPATASVQPMSTVPTTPVPHLPVQETSPLPGDPLPTPRRANDAFDPEAFNREFGSQAPRRSRR